MIQEDRVALMTKAAIYEKKEKRFSMNICQYYKKDYIALHMLVIWACITMAFAIVAAVIVFYITEQKSSISISFEQIEMAVVLLGIIYLMIVAVFEGIALTRYAIRYDDAESTVKDYEITLRRLEHSYKIKKKIEQARHSEMQENKKTI